MEAPTFTPILRELTKMVLNGVKKRFCQVRPDVDTSFLDILLPPSEGDSSTAEVIPPSSSAGVASPIDDLLPALQLLM